MFNADSFTQKLGVLVKVAVPRKWQSLVRDVNHLVQFLNGKKTVEMEVADASYDRDWRLIYLSANHHVII
jgi:hypothetical protein